MKRILIAGASLCALTACSQSNSSAASTKQDVVAALPPQAVGQIEALIAEKESRTPAQQKISSQLIYAANPAALAVSVPKLRSTVTPDAAGRVLVDVKGSMTPALLSKLASLGGQVVHSSAAHGSARVLIGLDKIQTVAAESSVRFIRPALEATTARHDAPVARFGNKFSTLSRSERAARLQAAIQQAALSRAPVGPVSTFESVGTNAGSVSDEGDHALGADRARNFFGVDGTGVKVGVLSDSDDFKEQAIASGDLPPDTVTVPGQSGRPGAGEGTAMMEIVHDVAPGAKLFFATAFNSPESFADNIRTLRFTFGCDIIVDDVEYFFESPYEDDIIAAAVDDIYNDGGIYFSSAGNEGNFDNGTSGTWDGTFRSGGTLSTLPSGYTVHDFGSGVISNIIEVGSGPLFLHWADPSSLDNPAATDDYDLFLLDGDLRNVAVASTDIQSAATPGLPFEFLGFNIPAGFRVVVAKKAGSATLPIRVQLSRGELAIGTAGASWGHNSARGAVGVAAVDVAEAGGGEFTGGPTTQAELFTSDGFRFIYFDRNNNPIPGGPQPRLQPSMSAPDGVSTTLPAGSGLNPFFGTSAAAPHAAAVAALLKSAQPDKPNSYITTIMASAATDIMAPGLDRDSGWGIVGAFNTLQLAGVQPVVHLNLGPVTTNTILPGGTGSMTVGLTNNGGRDAKTVSGTVSTTTPGVTMVNATSSYPNVEDDNPAPTNNDTPFTFSVAPSFPCGARINFTITVSFTGNGHSPVSFPFSVGTGRPSATVVVNPFTGARALIPDNNPSGVNVPITLSGVGAISAVSFHIGGTTPCSAAIGATTVGIDHTFVGDLSATLTSPAGTTVTLFSHPGGAGNSGNNFCQTILTDAATNSIQTILVAGAPWQGSFKPAQPLSAFSGQVADGTWILNVNDTASIDVGSVRAFSLDTQGFSCTP